MDFPVGIPGFDMKDLVATPRDVGIPPHVVQNTDGQLSAIDGRTPVDQDISSVCASASGRMTGSAGSTHWPACANSIMAARNLV